MIDTDPGDAPRDSGLAGLALTFGLGFGLTWALGLTDAFVLKALAACGLVLLMLARFLPLHRPRTRLGPANQVTLLRGVLTALLIALVGEGMGEALVWTAFALALISAALDGVDGRLARRLGWASPFGARFDMEVDAVLVAGLALLLWTLDRAGPWVLAAGAMRYLFVAAGALWPWLRNLITGRAEVRDAFLAQRFVPGLVPRRPALGGMADLTQVLLRAFDSGSLLRGKQSAGTEHPSTPAGRDGPSPGSNTPRDR